ncbi:hypothetical protein [Bacillus sp. SM2101]|nr:hypothetical protein [Bacillus sp. SM2101]
MIEKKIKLEAPDFADACKRSRSHLTMDVEFEEFENDLLEAIAVEENETN